jgi:hypothetical protein
MTHSAAAMNAMATPPRRSRRVHGASSSFAQAFQASQLFWKLHFGLIQGCDAICSRHRAVVIGRVGRTTTSPFVAAATKFCIANGLDTSRTQSTNVCTTGFNVRPFKVTIATGQERIGRSTGNKITEDAAPL